MNAFLETYVSEHFIERLGWVLLHSCWQFATVSLLAAVVLRFLQQRSSETRSTVLVGLLFVMTACPVATWLLLPETTTANSRAPVVALSVDSSMLPAAVPFLEDAAEQSNAPGTVLPTVPEPSPAVETTMDEVSNSVQWASGSLTPVMNHLPPKVWTRGLGDSVRPWLPWAVGLWGIGTLISAFRPAIGWLALRRLKRVGVSAASNDTLAMLDRLCGRLQMRTPVRVMQSTLARAPLVVGYVRPIILLPASLVTSLPVQQLEAILVHELAHIRRHDFLVNLVQVLVETLFFYHPAVWWLSGRIRVEREHCCDDLVVRTLDNRAEYGRALIAVEAACGNHAALALGASDGSLLARIRRLAGHPPERRGLSAASGLSAIALLLGLALAGVFIAQRSKAIASEFTSEDPQETSVSELPLPAGSSLRFGTSRYRMRKEIESMAVSTDGSFAVAGCESEAHRFDLATGRKDFSLLGVLGVAVSPDGKTILAKGERSIGFYDAETGERSRWLTSPENHWNWTDVIEFAPSGEFFAVAARQNEKANIPAAVHLIDRKTGDTIRVFPMENPESDLSSGFSKVLSVAFSPDGRFFASGGYDNDHGSYFARLWDVGTGEEVRRFDHGKHGHGIRSLVFSPDGKKLATRSHDGRTRLFDVPSGDVIKTFDKDGGGRERGMVAFSPDGIILAAAGDSLRLYDTVTNEERLRIDRHLVSNLRFVENGKTLIGAFMGAIYKWDVATGKAKTPVVADSSVAQVFVTPDERRILTHGVDGDAHVWDANSGEHLRRFYARWQRKIAMSPDGRYLAWSVRDESVVVRRQPSLFYGTRIRLYDVARNKFIDRFPGSTSDAEQITFSPDGRKLITVGHRDGSVHVWDFESGQEERSLVVFPEAEKDEFNQVTRAVLSPDGKTLVVIHPPYDNVIVQEDGTRVDRLGGKLQSPRPVRLWDIESGKFRGEIKKSDGSPPFASGEPCLFAPDGHLLFVGGYIVDPARGKLIRRLPTSQTVRAAAFTTDARFLVTANSKDVIQYWDVVTWEKTREFQAHDGVKTLCFSPSGQLFSGHEDSTTLAWDSPRVPVAKQEPTRPIRSEELTGVYYGKVNDYAVLLRFIGRQSRVPGQRGTVEGSFYVDTPGARVGSGVNFQDNLQTGAIDLHVGLWDGENEGSNWDRAIGKVERGVSGTLYLTTYRSATQKHYRYLKRIPLQKTSDNKQIRQEDMDVLEHGIEVHTKSDEKWLPFRPEKIAWTSEGSATVLRDKSIQLRGSKQWQDFTLYFRPQEFASIKQVRLEILPGETPPPRGDKKLMLFDVKPHVENANSERRDLEFQRSRFLGNVEDDTVDHCIDFMTDTGWTVPEFADGQTGHQVVLDFDEAVPIGKGDLFALTIDSGGSEELLTLSRVRVELTGARRSPKQEDGATLSEELGVRATTTAYESPPSQNSPFAEGSPFEIRGLIRDSSRSLNEPQEGVRHVSLDGADGKREAFLLDESQAALVTDKEILSFETLVENQQTSGEFNLVLRLTDAATQRLGDETRRRKKRDDGSAFGVMLHGRLLGIATPQVLAADRSRIRFRAGPDDVDELRVFLKSTCFHSHCQSVRVKELCDGIQVSARLAREDDGAGNRPVRFVYSFRNKSSEPVSIRLHTAGVPTETRSLKPAEETYLRVPVDLGYPDPPAGQYTIQPEVIAVDGRFYVQSTVTRLEDKERKRPISATSPSVSFEIENAARESGDQRLSDLNVERLEGVWRERFAIDSGRMLAHTHEKLHIQSGQTLAKSKEFVWELGQSRSHRYEVSQMPPLWDLGQLRIRSDRNPFWVDFHREKHGRKEIVPALIKRDNGRVLVALPDGWKLGESKRPLERPRSFDSTARNGVSLFALDFAFESR